MTDEEQNILYWQEIRKGGKQSLFDLYNNTYFHLVRFGLKLTANDEMVKDCITQLFLKLWDKHASLNDVSSVKSYLFTSLRHMLFDQMEYRSRMVAAITGFSDSEDYTELPYEEIIIRAQQDEELKNKLRKALGQLTPRQLELIRLKFFEGLTYEQVAEKTSQSIKTAYNTIYDATKVLRKALK